MEPQKYMIYEMHKNRSGWYLYAVKDLPGATLITGSDAMPPVEMPSEGVSASEIVPEMAGNGGVSLPENSGSSSDDGSSSEGEGESSESGDEDGTASDGEGSSEEDSSSEPPPEMQG